MGEVCCAMQALAVVWVALYGLTAKLGDHKDTRGADDAADADADDEEEEEAKAAAGGGMKAAGSGGACVRQ